MSKPWPTADYCTPGLRDGKVIIQLYRFEDEDGEGWMLPCAEVTIPDVRRFILTLDDMAKEIGE